MQIVQIEDVFRLKRYYIEVNEEIELSKDQQILIQKEKDSSVYRIVRLVHGENFRTVESLLKFKKTLTEAEINDFYQLQEGEIERLREARSLSEKLGLEMHFFSSKIGWKAQQSIFYFTSAKPVDFRELLKQMIKAFKGRIQLERVTERDRALMLDGTEICGGRSYGFLTGPNQKIPLDAVRDQGIVIKNNPKIFDSSGRIKPSMIFELAAYRKNRRFLPHIQQAVKVKDSGKTGKVTGLDILNHRCKVFFDELGIIEFHHVNELEFNNQRDIPEDLQKPVPEIDIEQRMKELEESAVGI